MRLETPAHAPSAPYALIRVLAKRLFDPYTRSILSDKEILVDTVSGLILAVNDVSSIQRHEFDEWISVGVANARVIDLRDAQLVLPGFVDTHVHCTSDSPLPFRLCLATLPHTHLCLLSLPTSL